MSIPLAAGTVVEVVVVVDTVEAEEDEEIMEEEIRAEAASSAAMRQTQAVSFMEQKPQSLIESTLDEEVGRGGGGEGEKGLCLMGLGGELEGNVGTVSGMEEEKEGGGGSC
jgi:hypothetical protein